MQSKRSIFTMRRWINWCRMEMQNNKSQKNSRKSQKTIADGLNALTSKENILFEVRDSAAYCRDSIFSYLANISLSDLKDASNSSKALLKEDCIEEIRSVASANNVPYFSIGISGKSAFVGAGEGELGFIYSIDGHEMKYYTLAATSLGAQVGQSSAVKITFWDIQRTEELRGLIRGTEASLAVLSGRRARAWFDKDHSLVGYGIGLSVGNSGNPIYASGIVRTFGFKAQ